MNNGKGTNMVFHVYDKTNEKFVRCPHAKPMYPQEA